jgi:fatty-acyl-CoA synthase
MHNDLSRQTLGDLLRRTRQRFPNKLAIRCGKIDWTYAEFDDTCNRFAAGLASQGIAIGDRVAVIARNSHAFAALRFALARLGAVLVPINFMLNADEARFILQHSGARMLCVDAGLAALGRAASSDTAVTQWIRLPSEDPAAPMEGMVTFDELLKHGTLEPRALRGDMLAQIIYTLSLIHI